MFQATTAKPQHQSNIDTASAADQNKVCSHFSRIFVCLSVCVFLQMLLPHVFVYIYSKK